MATTALLVGSMPFNHGVDIDSFGVQTISGNYYLRSATVSLSLLAAFKTLMTNAGVTDPVAVVQENLLVRLSASATFTVTWSSTELRDLLGFQANLSGLSSYIANDPSPLLWAPGYPATPRSRIGKAGRLVPHTTFHAADDGSRRETQHFGTETHQDLVWKTLISSRLTVRDDADDGNTLEGFHRTVLQYGYRLQYHETVETGTATTEIGWNDADAFGPYQLRSEMNPDWYERIIHNADTYGGPVRLELAISQEYS